MKKINIYFIAGLTALIAVTSCKKLNLTPVFEIPTTNAFQSAKDASAWDTGLYPSLRGVLYGGGNGYTYTTDVQADEFNAASDYGNNFGSYERWDAAFTNNDQNFTAIWQSYYRAIANINVAIAGLPTIPTTGASDVATVNQALGDSYLARAFYYHRLILRWAIAYNPPTAATDLGVPIVLKYNLTELPARATVAAVYSQILADISQAETLLAGVPGSQGAPRFTIDAARALEARVKLYMHDYAGAYTAATTLITSGKYPLITTAAAMSTYWKNDGIQESITQLFANNTTDVPNSMIEYLIPKSATNYDPYFVPSQWVLDLYPTTDIRKGVYFSTSFPVVVQGVSYPNISVLAKFQGNPALFTGALTNALQAPKMFHIGEMYLIAAEAAESLATPNEVNALAALNALKVARGETVSVSTGAALVQDIRDERERELIGEGFRLDDLKRWHLGFTRRSPQNNNMLVQGPGYATLTIAPDAQKFTWGIPFADTNINPNLVQNPGW